MQKDKFKVDLTFEEVDRILIYDPNTGSLTWKTGDIAGYLDKDGYRRVSIKNKRYLEHRIAWLLAYKKWPEYEIDHIDLSGSNNAIANLREATPSQNGMNKRLQANNTSGYKGVVWNKKDKRWNARIKVDNKTHYLGNYRRLEDAADRRLQAEREHFKEYAHA